MVSEGRGQSLYVFQDWKNNKGNFKSRIIMLLYRISSLIYRYRILRFIFFWYLLLYKFALGWLMNIGINSSAVIGKGLRIQYGFGTVIGSNTVIGKNCNIRQLTNISAKMKENGSYGRAPRIGDNVDIGISVVILGDVNIGNNVTIGAGSLITKDVEDNCVMVGSTATVLKRKYIISVEGA
ncbi:serine O-acetyltransferase [Pedobacter miscanthi]|uniref:Serine acetyltransferase n=1 Tax=Pedobacter miscanthi TaxID=2259170 RepID=A0A366LD36_9SPHI|nr:serine acetyltransferase [Pedobacter miscanthi]RBQ11808.1 serine acetyltransferase [Pedobacter miscanthi]